MQTASKRSNALAEQVKVHCGRGQPMSYLSPVQKKTSLPGITPHPVLKDPREKRWQLTSRLLNGRDNLLIVAYGGTSTPRRTALGTLTLRSVFEGHGIPKVLIAVKLSFGCQTLKVLYLNGDWSLQLQTLCTHKPTGLEERKAQIIIKTYLICRLRLMLHMHTWLF